MYCSKCGKETVNNALFCGNCGSKIIEEVELQHTEATNQNLNVAGNNKKSNNLGVLIVLLSFVSITVIIIAIAYFIVTAIVEESSSGGGGRRASRDVSDEKEYDVINDLFGRESDSIDVESDAISIESDVTNERFAVFEGQFTKEEREEYNRVFGYLVEYYLSMLALDGNQDYTTDAITGLGQAKNGDLAKLGDIYLILREENISFICELEMAGYNYMIWSNISFDEKDEELYYKSFNLMLVTDNDQASEEIAKFTDYEYEDYINLIDKNKFKELDDLFIELHDSVMNSDMSVKEAAIADMILNGGTINFSDVDLDGSIMSADEYYELFEKKEIKDDDGVVRLKRIN